MVSHAAVLALVLASCVGPPASEPIPTASATPVSTASDTSATEAASPKSAPMDISMTRANPRNECERAWVEPDSSRLRTEAEHRRIFDACTFSDLVAAIEYLGLNIQVPEDYVHYECDHKNSLQGAQLCLEVAS